jgi:hypothetical protein
VAGLGEGAGIGGASGSPSGVSGAQAKQIGLAFERMLVGELAQQLAGTASASDSQDGSGDGAGGLMGSDPASTAYAQLIPDTLTSSIMSAGGIGIAQQIAASLDPSGSSSQAVKR